MEGEGWLGRLLIPSKQNTLVVGMQVAGVVACKFGLDEEFDGYGVFNKRSGVVVRGAVRYDVDVEVDVNESENIHARGSSGFGFLETR